MDLRTRGIIAARIFPIGDVRRIAEAATGLREPRMQGNKRPGAEKPSENHLPVTVNRLGPSHLEAMRRTNAGAARRMAITRPGRGGGTQDEGARRSPPEPDLSPRTPLSRITALPVAVNPSVSAVKQADHTALVRIVDGITARSVSPRLLEASGADVVLLDARASRPTMAYRAVAKVRNAGWSKGIVLLIDPDQLPIVSVASSIGATDFVLSTAMPDELEARLRRSATREMRNAPRATGELDSGIQLHWRMHQVSFEGTTISLTLREIQLLSVLMEHGREVMTADDLARLAWGKPREPGGGLTAAYVCSLRKKLAWFGGRFGIQTVRGVGYRFVV